ncbi:mastermind-like domain-containing protein 1 isoform X3 [Tachyglossus aculeatus]|uniref:mastermind-like domain-containing protein 1 isoform X3 n=1 Tax=Tachyglossus aculeatus TaxID=9261 RepID=UPI0018F2B897|nr:mastermind-like domain-containing protein 1 isoform X3 [Tachyglossus aculeatus]
MLLVSQRVEAPRMEPHIPSQGSIKRKLEGDSSPAAGVGPEGIYANDVKRPCLDDVTLSLGQSTNASVSCPEMQNSPFSMNHSTPPLGVTAHPGLLENSHMNGSSIGSPFSVPPNPEMGQKGSMGGQNNMIHYDEKVNNLQSMDQELQDLLEELTKMPDPSPNELDLEKILGSKPEEPLAMGHPQPALSTTPKPSPQTSHLENHMSAKEFSPGCNPTSGGSPQMRPSSAGASYPVPPPNKPTASPISSTAQGKNPSQPLLPVSLPTLPGPHWHHAHQLKALAASKQVSSTKQPVSAGNWSTMSPPGLSPPYRQGSSPHHQPFSPQNVLVSGMATNSLPGNSIQSPPNSLLSSMASSGNPTSGPSPPYGSEKLSSPALSQQQFSPQNPMLATMAPAAITANNIKSPQSNLVSNMAPTSTGPSPPYRPEKLSSPALHQQPFSPQNALIPAITPASNSTSMQSSLYKSMATNQPKSLNVILHQSPNGLQSSLVNESAVAQEQFSFSNTKPLSHFASESAPQKMPSMPAGTGQPSLLHYLQQPQQASSGQQAQQSPSNAQFLLQRIMLPRQQIQRQMQPATLSSQPRQESNPGIVARLQEPGTLPSAGSSAPAPAPAPATVNGCMRNHLLKQQILRRQHIMQQEKQRPNIMAVASDQRTSFVPQQMSQFQIPQPMSSDCGQPMPTPPPNHRMMSSTSGILQNALGSGIIPTTVNQNSGTMVMIPHNPTKHPGMFPPSPDFNISLRPSQTSLGLGSGCQTAHSHSAARAGMALPAFSSNPLANHSASPLHIRQPSMPRIPSVYTNSSSQLWTPAGVSRMPSQSQVDSSMQQFSNSPLFSKQNVRPNLPGQQFSHQAVVPPNQIAPGVQVRQIPKLNITQPSQSLSPLNSQNLRHNLTRGPMPAMSVMKSMPQSVSGFNQLGSAPGIGPPSYPSTGQPSGTFGRMSSSAELPQYDFVPQQNNSILPANCSETDFIDSLMKNSSSTDEDWLNNLTMIDDILGQHAPSSGHV